MKESCRLVDLERDVNDQKEGCDHKKDGEA